MSAGPDLRRRCKAVAVTGAGGFVGGHLVGALDDAGYEVRRLSRIALEAASEGGADAVLAGCDAVVHLAGRAHVLDEERGDALLDVYRRTNRDSTLQMAHAAARNGVQRFVFVSSIRVNGSASTRPFRPEDAPQPDEPYAISKHEAEVGLWKVAAEAGLEVVVVRPPLVYGPGVKANFMRLMALVRSGIPLPLASVQGRRSLIGVRNICDLLRICMEHPRAAGKVLLASDGEDVTLPDLIRLIAVGMERPARLFPMPLVLLRAIASVAGRRTALEKLSASLQVDASATFAALEWRPPVSLRAGIAETARWYMQQDRPPPAAEENG